MNKIIFLAIGLIFQTSGYAASDKICDDLYRITCAPGEYNDGTGVASNRTSIGSKELAIFENVFKEANKKFSEVLGKAENSYFRKAVLSATGLSLSTKCKGAEDKPSAECLKDMSSGLTEIFYKQQLATKGGRYSNFNLQGMADVSDLTYVTDSPIYQSTTQNILNKAKELVGLDNVEKKARDVVFPKVREALLKKVNSLVSDEQTRKKLIDKISAIRFDNSDCSNGNSTSIPGLLLPNAFYLPQANVFKFCAGMGLNNSSEFQMAFIIAHELSHSIDPCTIEVGPSDFTFKYPKGANQSESEGAFPIKNIIQCLRTKESIGALTDAQTQAKHSMTNNQYGGYTYQTSPAHGSAQAMDFKSFCGLDQITESFSDWMAAEITPEYISSVHPKLSKDQLRLGYSNIWRGNCDTDALPAMPSPHPEKEARTNRIILVQPKIREQMGCSKELNSNQVYCDTNKSHSSPPAPAKKEMQVVPAFMRGDK